MTRPSILIREAQERDLSACAELWHAMFVEARIPTVAEFAVDWKRRFVAYVRRRMERDELRYFVAERGGSIVGAAGALLRDGYPSTIHGVRSGYIFGVCVKPEARKRGIATLLTRRTIEWLRQRDVRRISLHATDAGAPVYERLGFVRANEMVLPH
jgi:ribosomal protein S18 acetylase RimI-like enzyme